MRVFFFLYYIIGFFGFLFNFNGFGLIFINESLLVFFSIVYNVML